MIHDENPFAPVEDDPLRRFRGRLAQPVTIVTAGEGADKTGLTVSSLFVVDGDPPVCLAAVGPNADLYDVARGSGSFVVHICRQGQEGIADVFAGVRPSPGGLFASLEWVQGQWGPELVALPDRARCSFDSIDELGWSGLLTGSIDEIEVAELTSPLVHFRGAYRGLG